MKAATAMREAAGKMGRKLFESWAYAVPGFEKALAWLHGDPKGWRSGETIWQAGRNDVIRLQLPPECGEYEIIYKHTKGPRRWRHAVRPSSSFREAANLLAMANLGLPMAELLAVGETRTLKGWSESFIATRFAAGCRDGRHFLPGYEYGDRPDVRDAFLHTVLHWLAKMHDVRLYHKAFKLYNILWREAGSGVKVVFIDVSSCKPIRWRNFHPYRVHDLADLFCPLSLSDDELRAWLAHYCDCCTNAAPNPDAMLADVHVAIGKSHFNWEQVEREKRRA